MIAESISGLFTSLLSALTSFLVTSIFVSGCDPHTNFPTARIVLVVVLRPRPFSGCGRSEHPADCLLHSILYHPGKPSPSPNRRRRDGDDSGGTYGALNASQA